MKKLLSAIILFAFATSSYSATVNAVTGVGDGTDWSDFIAQITKDNSKLQTFQNGIGNIKHVQVALAASDLIAMNAAPVVLVAAPGAGKSLAIAKVMFTITRSATAFTGGGAAQVQYSATAANGGTLACDSTLASTVVTGAAGTTVTLRNGAVISDLAGASIQNIGLYITNATAAFATGTGTATVDVWYGVY